MNKFRLNGFAFLSLITLLSSLAMGATKPRDIKLDVEKVGDQIRWMPGEIKVKPGENVNFVLNYKLEGGFDFHGFSIPALNIEKSVDRNKTLEVPAKISLKPGTYDIICQFHPKHGKSQLVVEAPVGKPNSKTLKGGGSPAIPPTETN